ncbi:Rhodanese-like protein [Microthyrium microscopicum]|uniref:Rhodanese-like protein n=1 Tax=Microthyrium microscopicum TaxID=703497 RepID=A0A6A6U5J3_9PEZI|nr:Rhodanese-like protein [Microthyrium microscopicum]
MSPTHLRSSFQTTFFAIATPNLKLRATGYIIQTRLQSTTSNTDLSSAPASSQALLSSFLVTPTALSNALRKNVYTKLSTSPRVIPLCAAWFMPNDPKSRTGHAAYLAGHVPRARFFDLDAVSDKNSPYPHMLPSPEVFAQALGKLGIRRDDSVVVYDSAELGIFSAPRVAWTLRVFGHPEIHILNNFKTWVDQGLPVEKGEPEEKVSEESYPVPTIDSSMVESFDELKQRLSEQEGKKEGAEAFTVIDARSPGRFDGSDAEPRPGISSGHMPSAINIPFTDVLSARTKAFLSPEELRVYFECKNVDPKKPIVSSCGTGVTACVIDAALTEAGYPQEGRKVYDGSWTEWAMREEEVKDLIVKGDK